MMYNSNHSSNSRPGSAWTPSGSAAALAADTWGQREWGRCKSNEFWQIGEKGTAWHVETDMKFAVTSLVLTPICHGMTDQLQAEVYAQSAACALRLATCFVRNSDH